DGIRDYKVTGVQTCALPISMVCCCGEARSETASKTVRMAKRKFMGSPKKRDYTQIKTPTTEARRRGEKAKPLKHGGTEAREEKRSEERRVGKECRERRRRDQ